MSLHIIWYLGALLHLVWKNKIIFIYTIFHRLIKQSKSSTTSHWSISYFQSIHFNPSRTLNLTTNFMELLFYSLLCCCWVCTVVFSVFMVAFYSEIPIGDSVYPLTNIELNQKRNRTLHLLTGFFIFFYQAIMSLWWFVRISNTSYIHSMVS
jgi:hypothetical protein